MTARLAAVTAEERRAAAAKQASDERERRARRIGSAGIPITDAMRAALVGGTFANTGCMTAIEHFRSVDEPRKSWLFLAGPPGSGKSIAAAEAIACCGGVWVSAQQLPRIFAANFGDQYEAQETVRTASLLVIDDLGTEQDSQRMAAILIELLDARKSMSRHPTIATSNLTSASFLARYSAAGDRLSSRLAEQATWYADAAADMRRTT